MQLFYSLLFTSQPAWKCRILLLGAGVPPSSPCDHGNALRIPRWWRVRKIWKKGMQCTSRVTWCYFFKKWIPPPADKISFLRNTRETEKSSFKKWLHKAGRWFCVTVITQAVDSQWDKLTSHRYLWHERQLQTQRLLMRAGVSRSLATTQKREDRLMKTDLRLWLASLLCLVSFISTKQSWGKNEAEAH